MATSDSVNYSVTAQDIIIEALELIGVLGEGETPNQDQLDSAVRTLNMLIKNWQARGYSIFSLQDIYLFPPKGKPSYVLDHSSEDFDTVLLDYYKREISTAGTAGDQYIELEIVDFIENGMEIGIQRGSDELFWTFVDSVTNNTVFLVDSLPEDVEEGYVTYIVVEKAKTPLTVVDAYYERNNGSSYPIWVYSRVDYDELANKTQSGSVNIIYYDNRHPNALLKVWPTAVNELDLIRLVVTRKLEDIDDVTNDLDFPQEWYLPLAYNLAFMLAPKYGIPLMDYQRITLMAREFLDTVEDFDQEMYTSMFFEPERLR